MNVSAFWKWLLHTIQELVEPHLAAITLSFSLSRVAVEEFGSTLQFTEGLSTASQLGWSLDFGPLQVMLFFSSRSVFGFIVLLVEWVQTLAVGLTFDSKILWCADESTADSTTARCPGSVALHPRPIVCAHALCLLFVKHGFMHYYQKSPLWSCLLRGHCSRSFYFVSDATLQISNVLPCSFYRGDDVFPD